MLLLTHIAIGIITSLIALIIVFAKSLKQNRIYASLITMNIGAIVAIITGVVVALQHEPNVGVMCARIGVYLALVTGANYLAYSRANVHVFAPVLADTEL